VSRGLNMLSFEKSGIRTVFQKAVSSFLKNRN
jgi:hypothetical protein